MKKKAIWQHTIVYLQRLVCEMLKPACKAMLVYEQLLYFLEISQYFFSPENESLGANVYEHKYRYTRLWKLDKLYLKNLVNMHVVNVFYKVSAAMVYSCR